MKRMWHGGEVAVLYLFKRPQGEAQGLCQETCCFFLPQVLERVGQVALMLCKA